MKLLFCAMFVLLIACNKEKESPYSKSVRQADLYYKNEKYYEAFQIYDALARVDSSNGEHCFQLAKCEYALDMDKEANQDFHHAMYLGYDKYKSYFNLAIINLFLKDSLSVVYFKETLKAKPGDEEAQFLLSETIHRNRKDAGLK